MSLNTPKWLIVHHTGGTNANPLADTSHHTFEMVKQYHLSLGWEDIGYHFFISKDGALKAGRAENYHGAHTLGHNTDSLGICLAGNFDATKPTEAQIKTLKVLLRDLCAKYLIPRENIVPHRRFAAKTCYGKNLPDDWAEKLTDNAPLKERLVKLSLELKDIAESI